MERVERVGQLGVKKKAIIIGAGPHSCVIAEILLQTNEYEIAGMIDSSTQPVLGIPVIGNDNDLPRLYESGIGRAFIALGDNGLREKLALHAQKIGFKLVNAISPYAHISAYAQVGQGVAIMAGAIVNPRTVIGDGAIINTNASIDHDCRIGNYTHIAPGCAISGSTKIGSRCFLGTGTRVIDKLTIGNEVIIGAGAAVVGNLPDRCTAVGVPARIIKAAENGSNGH